MRFSSAVKSIYAVEIKQEENCIIYVKGCKGVLNRSFWDINLLLRNRLLIIYFKVSYIQGKF